MTWIAVGVMVVGTIVTTAYSAYAQYQQGLAQEAMWQAEADMATAKAASERERADIKSDMAQDQGMAEDRKLKRRQLQLIGKQKAELAAMGISGVTAEDIMSDTLQVQDMDTATLHYNADLASWEAKTTGDYNEWALKNEAAMARASKINTRKATRTAITGTLIDGAVSIAGSVASGGTSKMGAPKATGSYQAGLTGKFQGVKTLQTGSSRSSFPTYKSSF